MVSETELEISIGDVCGPKGILLLKLLFMNLVALVFPEVFQNEMEPCWINDKIPCNMPPNNRLDFILRLYLQTVVLAIVFHWISAWWIHPLNSKTKRESQIIQHWKKKSQIFWVILEMDKHRDYVHKSTSFSSVFLLWSCFFICDHHFFIHTLPSIRLKSHSAFYFPTGLWFLQGPCRDLKRNACA